MAQESRQASAQEIYSEEVDNGMIRAGMCAHKDFCAMPEGPGKARAEMVARIYAAMEASRRSGLQETSPVPMPAEQ